jgi:hypothetical protein
VLRPRSSSVAMQNDSAHMPGHTNHFSRNGLDAERTSGFRLLCGRVLVYDVVRPVRGGRPHPVS